MSEHDEEQAPPEPWRPARARRPPADDTLIDYSEPRSPWASPGGGRPFPGEPDWGDRPVRRPEPPPAPPDAAPFAYPYPGASASDGTAPSPSRGRYGDAPIYGSPGYPDPAAYRSSEHRAPTYPGAPGNATPAHGAPQYPGAPYGTPAPYGNGGPGYSPPPYTDAAPGYATPPPYTDGGPGYGPPPYTDPAYATPPPYPPGGPGDTSGYPNADWYLGYGGNGGGYSGGWPPQPPGYAWAPQPQPGWAPVPPAAPPHRNTLAIIGIAILVAALIGLGIGGQLIGRRTTIGRLPTIFPQQPASGNGTVSGSGLPSDQAAAIAKAVDPSVVDINTRLGYQQAAAAGTGMVLTSDGEVLTNNHVIAGSTSVTATVVGGKMYTVKVLGTDPSEDVALIKLEGASGLTPIKTGDPSKLSTGDPIVAVGNAGGLGGTPSVVSGTVEALDQSVTASDLGGSNSEQLSGLIQINAPLLPGDSGGPLINTRREVVGMDTAASAASRIAQVGVGFAIPITKATSIASQIAAGKASTTIQIGLPGFLGVSVATTNTGTIPGAPVIGLLPGTPAEKVGLAAGDVITSVNGQPVDSPKSLTAVLQQRHAGDKVTVGWTDPSGATHKATVTLASGPAA